MTTTREMHERHVLGDLDVNALFHEAAHAVIGERLAPGATRAIVIDPAGENGYLESGHVETTMEVGTEERALVALAGVAAERLSNRKGKKWRTREFLRGKRLNPNAANWPQPSPTDREEISAYVRKTWGRHRRRQLRRQLENRAAGLVRQNWPAICRVAEALVQEADRQGVDLGDAEIRLSRAAFLAAMD